MGERVAALAFLAASGLYLAGALTFPLGTGARPGPGFFPVAIGVFACAVAAGFVILTYRRSGPPGIAVAPTEPPMTADARGRVAVAAAGLVGFCLLLPWLGYLIASFAFVAVLLRRLGGGGWTGAIAVAVGAAAVSYYVFAVLLGVPLPRGVVLP
jgi:putative tricarboxylic transport membrane protein